MVHLTPVIEKSLGTSYRSALCSLLGLPSSCPNAVVHEVPGYKTLWHVRDTTVAYKSFF